MASGFLKFLKDADTKMDDIQHELAGDTLEIEVFRNRKGKRTGVQKQWIPPTKVPSRRNSKILNAMIKQSYPDTPARQTSAALLLEVWKDVVESTKGSNLRTFMQIFNILQKLLQAFYSNEGTLAASVTAWRKPIRDKYQDHSDIYKQSMYVLGISRERSLARREDYQNRVRASVKTRGQRIKYKLDQILSVIDTCNSSTNELDYIIAVLLCTGSRLIECIKVSEYSLVNGEPGMIKLLGVAKDRTAAKARRDEIKEDDDVIMQKSVVKPVIRLTPQRIIWMVGAIRLKWDFSALSNSQATAKVDGAVNRRLKDYFGDTDASIPTTKATTSHKLRFIYANLSYKLYGEPQQIPEGEWVRSVLAHDSGDVSLIYQQILVEVPGDKKKVVPDDVRLKLTEIQHDLKENKEEHIELKSDITEVTEALDRGIAEAQAIPLEYSSLANPKRVRLSEPKKLELLEALDHKYSDIGQRFTQKLAKKYGYGSTIIQTYWSRRRL
jgi:hypothetical protein